MTGMVKMNNEYSLRLLISLALMLVFYCMFGAQNMERLKENDIETTKNEEDTSIIPSPCI